MEEKEEIEITLEELPITLVIEVTFLALFILLPSTYFIIKLISGIISIIVIPGYATVSFLGAFRSTKMLDLLSLGTIIGFVYFSCIFLILSLLKVGTFLVPIIALITTLLLYIRERQITRIAERNEFLSFLPFLIFLSIFIPSVFQIMNTGILNGQVEAITYGRVIENLAAPFLSYESLELKPNLVIPSYSLFLYISNNEQIITSFTYSTFSYVLFFLAIHLILSRFVSSRIVIAILSFSLVIFFPTFIYILGIGFSSLIISIAILSTFAYYLTKPLDVKDGTLTLLFLGASLILLSKYAGMLVITTLGLFLALKYGIKKEKEKKNVIINYVLLLFVPLSVIYLVWYHILGFGYEQILNLSLFNSSYLLATILIAGIASYSFVIEIKRKNRLGLVFLSWVFASLLLLTISISFSIFLLFILTVLASMSLAQIIPNVNVRKLSKVEIILVILILVAPFYSIAFGTHILPTAINGSKEKVKYDCNEVKNIIEKIERKIEFGRVILAPKDVARLLKVFAYSKVISANNNNNLSKIASKIIFSNYEILSKGIRIREYVGYLLHIAPIIEINLDNRYKGIFVIDETKNKIYLRTNETMQISKLHKSEVGLKEEKGFASIRYDYTAPWIKIRKQEEVVNSSKLIITYIVIDYSKEKMLKEMEIDLFFTNKKYEKIAEDTAKLKEITILSKDKLRVILEGEEKIILEFKGDFKKFKISKEKISLYFEKSDEKRFMEAEINLYIENYSDLGNVKTFLSSELLTYMHKNFGTIYIVIPKEEILMKRFSTDEFVKIYDGKELVALMINMTKIKV